jgi:hypothetical protein
LISAAPVLAQTAQGTSFEPWYDTMLRVELTEAPKQATTLVLLGMGWLIGRHLTLLWSRTQKENEQDLEAARDFHSLYGEFFSLWKLWNYYRRNIGPDALPGSSRWEILDRACRSEARLEATVVRLSSMKHLTAKEIEILGRFRQRYQQLREAVRDNVALAWDHSEHPDYVEFKKLAPRVAAIIARSRPISRDLLMQVTSTIHEIPNKRERNVSEKPVASA